MPPAFSPAQQATECLPSVGWLVGWFVGCLVPERVGQTTPGQPTFPADRHREPLHRCGGPPPLSGEVRACRGSSDPYNIQDAAAEDLIHHRFAAVPLPLKGKAFKGVLPKVFPFRGRCQAACGLTDEVPQATERFHRELPSTFSKQASEQVP